MGEWLGSLGTSYEKRYKAYAWVQDCSFPPLPLPHLTMKAATLFPVLALLAGAAATPTPSPLTFLGPGTVHANGAHNIHVSYSNPSSLSETVILVYGDCDINHHSASHHEIGRFDARDHDEKP